MVVLYTFLNYKNGVEVGPDDFTSVPNADYFYESKSNIVIDYYTYDKMFHNGSTDEKYLMYVGKTTLVDYNKNLYKVHYAKRLKPDEIDSLSESSFPTPIGSGSYSSAVYFPEKDSIAKISKLSDENVVPPDFIKELAYYTFLKKSNCSVLFKGFDIGRVHSYLYLEKGLGSMRSVIERLGVGINAARTLFKNMLVDLKAFHAMKIVLADIKPENVLIMSDGTTRFIDFGLSGDLNTTALSAYTPTFTAPEILISKFLNTQFSLTSKADVFALGLMFLECLANRDIYSEIENLAESGEYSEIEEILLFFKDVDRSTDFKEYLGDMFKLSIEESERKARTFIEIYMSDSDVVLPPGLEEALVKMLHVNPNHRAEASEVLELGYFKDVKYPGKCEEKLPEQPNINVTLNQKTIEYFIVAGVKVLDTPRSIHRAIVLYQRYLNAGGQDNVVSAAATLYIVTHIHTNYVYDLEDMMKYFCIKGADEYKLASSINQIIIKLNGDLITHIPELDQLDYINMNIFKSSKPDLLDMKQKILSQYSRV